MPQSRTPHPLLFVYHRVRAPPAAARGACAVARRSAGRRAPGAGRHQGHRLPLHQHRLSDLRIATRLRSGGSCRAFAPRASCSGSSIRTRPTTRRRFASTWRRFHTPARWRRCAIPRTALVKFTSATVTPEAAVVAGGRVVYRGRIDDRYVDLGVERPSPTVHDLADALAAISPASRSPHATTQAVGCFIADFAR